MRGGKDRGNKSLRRQWRLLLTLAGSASNNRHAYRKAHVTLCRTGMAYLVNDSLAKLRDLNVGAIQG